MNQRLLLLFSAVALVFTLEQANSQTAEAPQTTQETPEGAQTVNPTAEDSQAPKDVKAEEQGPEDPGTRKQAPEDSKAVKQTPKASNTVKPTPEDAPAVKQTAEDSQTVKQITVEGNRKVESDAVLTTIKTRTEDPLDPKKIREDIKALHELGYFSDIKVFSEPADGGVRLIYAVKEKPAIVEIQFNGLHELTEEDVKEKLETKLFTIVNEHQINNDLQVIERQYLEKGFFLASASYKLEPKDGNENEVILHYNIEEGGKVQVAELDIVGNEYFTDADLIDKFASKPVTRSSTFQTPGSLYNDELVKRDLEVLAYLYKDQGFAEVKVAKPVEVMDSDREFVRITFEVEEGIQYNVGTIDITGDLLFDKKELLESLKLKPGALFRYSFFSKDVETLFNKYADKGYAFTDVNPIPTFDREKKLVNLNFNITKGEKVYFGEITIVGNTKTRDNVIRREIEIADSELFNQTNLTKSKSNVERLGFFEEVQSIKKRDDKEPNILHYKFKIKEKPTGQLQAALGFSPGKKDVDQSNWFGQGRYSEENQSGRGWKTGLSGKWNGDKNYSLDLNMKDPRVNDSQWSLGFGAYFGNTATKRAEIDIETRTIGGNVEVGRTLFELVRGTVTYQIEKTKQISDKFLIDRLREEGVESSIILGLSRNSTDNYLDPSEGSVIRLSQKFTGGPVLRGDHQYLESIASTDYYYPVDFTETYRTYFRAHGSYRMLWPAGGKQIPLSKRYLLGGYDDLRGYETETVGPSFSILNAPGDRAQRFDKGGTKRVLFQVEYFFPIIKEANIKGLLFTDKGRVYDDGEPFELKGYRSDVGFGFRWITPIAPFRFEFAYPIENGKLGDDRQFIFYIGF
ncbi:MAG: outer membrane protein assembly factor BamA [Oligoflexales bacterium]